MKLFVFLIERFLDEIPAAEDDVQPAVGIYLYALDHLVDDGIVVLHLSRRTICDDLLQLEDAAIIPLVREEGVLQLFDSPLQEFDGIGKLLEFRLMAFNALAALYALMVRVSGFSQP